MKLLTLFFSFLQIGAFSFGGGYAALPLIQHQVVDLYHWLTMNELTDLITISQMTPGPIAINAATFVGLKIDSFYGAIVATLGCILPSYIIVSLIAYIYLKYQQMSIIQNILKYIRPAVVSLIAVSGLLIIVSCFFGDTVNFANLKFGSVAIFIVALVLLRKQKMNPITVMVIAGIIQIGLYYIGIS